MLKHNPRTIAHALLTIVLMTAVVSSAAAQAPTKKPAPKHKSVPVHKKPAATKHPAVTTHRKPAATVKHAATHKKPATGTKAVKKTKPEVYRYVDQPPVFPGDMSGYLSARLQYPQDARENAISGKVYVQFVIDTDGSISDVSVQKSSGNTQLDAEAVRVISSMPPWSPGKLNGQPVKCYFQIPIVFALD